MGSKRISRIIIIFFAGVIISCSGNNGRPVSVFEGPGPVAIAPNVINGDGEILFVGGIMSHWLYGVNLIDFYPFDINGSADGNKIDNFSLIDDIAVSSDGRFLFAGGGAIIKVYDMLHPESPASFSITGWVTSIRSDPSDPGAVFVTSWDGRDGGLYKLKVNINESGELSVDSKQITFPDMLPLKVILNSVTLQFFPPLLYLLFKDPPSIKACNYSTPDSGFVAELPLLKRPEYAALVSDGSAFYVIFEDSTISKYERDTGTEIIQAESPGISELPRSLDGVPMNIASLPATSNYPEMVIIPDGTGYLDLLDASTGCPVVNISYTYRGFTDTGDASNPSLEEVLLSSCNTKTEDWTISYHGKIFETDKNTGETYSFQDLFVDNTVNFIDLQINPGDILSVMTSAIAGEYAILEVIDENRLRVDRTFSSDMDSIMYNIKGIPYLVKGSISGIQRKRAYENEPYISDRGAIGFKIIPKEKPATEGDTFYLSTMSERIRLEGLPYGVAVDSSNLIYISNFGTGSISVIDPSQLKVIDTLR